MCHQINRLTKPNIYRHFKFLSEKVHPCIVWKKRLPCASDSQKRLKMPKRYMRPFSLITPLNIWSISLRYLFSSCKQPREVNSAFSGIRELKKAKSDWPTIFRRPLPLLDICDRWNMWEKDQDTIETQSLQNLIKVGDVDDIDRTRCIA